MIVEGQVKLDPNYYQATRQVSKHFKNLCFGVHRFLSPAHILLPCCFIWNQQWYNAININFIYLSARTLNRKKKKEIIIASTSKQNLYFGVLGQKEGQFLIHFYRPTIVFCKIKALGRRIINIDIDLLLRTKGILVRYCDLLKFTIWNGVRTPAVHCLLSLCFLDLVHLLFMIA